MCGPSIGASLVGALDEADTGDITRTTDKDTCVGPKA